MKYIGSHMYMVKSMSDRTFKQNRVHIRFANSSRETEHPYESKQFFPTLHSDSACVTLAVRNSVHARYLLSSGTNASSDSSRPKGDRRPQYGCVATVFEIS